jgi:tetratricopeptide (TPR) repeat protein
MRALLDRLKKDFAGFVEQRDDLILISSCSDNDVAVGLKILRDLEQASAADVFLLFSDNFVQPGPFVSVAVERLREDHRLASAALVEEGRNPLPEFPASLADGSRPPAQRLIEAMTFARSLLPRKGGHRLAWAMFPLEIKDRHEYLRFVSEFVPWSGLKPWMNGLRLIFRDLPATGQFAPTLAAGPRVHLGSFDFGPDATAESFEQDAQNQELPEDERMQSLLMSAGLDYAHNRTESAVGKYKLLLGYYQKTDNALMQAFVLNAFGEMAHRAGDLEKAQLWFECALVPAEKAKEPVLLTALGRNLGDIAFKQARYPEAEQYYDNVDKLASHMLDPEAKIRALEARGLSQEKQGAFDKAVGSWEAAAHLSRKIELPEFLRKNLEHLARVYRQFGMTDRLPQLEAELAASVASGRA